MLFQKYYCELNDSRVHFLVKIVFNMFKTKQASNVMCVSINK